MQEKRQHPRRELHLEVAFERGEGGRLAAVCRDISLGGAFLETSTPAGFGEAVTVHLRLPGLDCETVVKAVVRWTKPDGMGVQFAPMGARETHALLTMLKAS